MDLGNNNQLGTKQQLSNLVKMYLNRKLSEEVDYLEKLGGEIIVILNAYIVIGCWL